MFRFSTRLPADLSANPLSELLERKRADNNDVIDLTESNPTRVGMEYPETEILASLAQRESMIYEPHPRGLRGAREAVAAYFTGRGHAMDAESVILTAGSSESYGYLLKLLADKGDEVLAPRPSYPLVEYLAGLETVHTVPYALRYQRRDGWRLDMKSITENCTVRSKAVIIINPNNPTGHYMRREELDMLARFCADRGLALISDEVFLDYPLRESDFGSGIPTGTASALDIESDALVFVLGGFSKMLALPQFKLGWITSSGPPALLHDALQRLDLISDTYLTVNTPVQHAAAELLRLAPRIQTQIRHRCSANLASLRRVMTDMPDAELLPVEAGWNAVLRLRDDIDEETLVMTLLNEHDVLTHPGFFFDFDEGSHLVLSLLPLPDRMEEGVNRLRERLSAD